MKLTFIRVPALLPVLLLSSQTVLAAHQAPKVDTGRSCPSPRPPAAIATRNTASCEQDENNARATLEKEWNQFAPLDQADCTRLMTSGGSPSYVELLTCLEMAKQVKELPGGDQLDTGKPVEKSRHIK